MTIQENIPLAPKTTMRIGGTARHFAELTTKQDVEEAWKFAKEKNIPLIVLGAGANTVFADGTIEALVVRILAQEIEVSGNTVRADAGTILATLVATLAKRGLDLSTLAGIPGTVGGAIFGNAGQGPQGVWIDHYVQTVTVFAGGEWKTLSKDECRFSYRESVFKHWPPPVPPILWKITLTVPSRAADDIEKDITMLLRKRSVAQPNFRTAGSCFKAQPDGTPAWKLIEAAGLKGSKIGDLQISDKHANFLINTGSASFDDLLKTVEKVRASVTQPLHLEMRLIGQDGRAIS
ncbi:MAG: UDP-N-acetylmuramate dehydrogenase [Candidatus Peribacteraceae bacterium]|nr:UDP-N-acetylmuramate dehydrogenase [Candidatus Peribacteraceae bacterium]MDD5074367.1 UDP-N-acetylmuramate dehydrogenase [Candidatus Peribacteraceae bacterium]